MTEVNEYQELIAEDAAILKLTVAERVLSLDNALDAMTARHPGLTRYGAQTLVDPDLPQPRCEMREA